MRDRQRFLQLRSPLGDQSDRVRSPPPSERSGASALKWLSSGAVACRYLKGELVAATANLVQANK